MRTISDRPEEVSTLSITSSTSRSRSPRQVAAVRHAIAGRSPPARARIRPTRAARTPRRRRARPPAPAAARKGASCPTPPRRSPSASVRPPPGERQHRSSPLATDQRPNPDGKPGLRTRSRLAGGGESGAAVMGTLASRIRCHRRCHHPAATRCQSTRRTSAGILTSSKYRSDDQSMATIADWPLWARRRVSRVRRCVERGSRPPKPLITGSQLG